jgi:hypothetical protein
VVLCFSVLMIEIKQLSRLAEDRFYGGLTMFGHALENSDDAYTKPLSPEAQIGAVLPFLADLLNLTTRLNDLGRNVVLQLACLYHEKEPLYKATFKQVQLEVVYQALGELCRVLLTLDAIIEDNQSIAFSWGAYKGMIK